MTTPGRSEGLGVDACRRGWVGIAIDGTRCAAYFGVTITDVVAAGEADGAFDVVAIDIPIGLPDSTSRQADDHASASHINRELTGSGISVQAFMLKPKLLEVEAWAPPLGRRVVSCAGSHGRCRASRSGSATG